MLLRNVRSVVITPTSQAPSLQVVNKCKKDITDRARQRKLNVQLVKLEVVATQPAKIVTLGCIKTHQAIQHAITVQVVSATKLPVRLGAMLYPPAPTAGMVRFKNVHRVITAKEKQTTKPPACKASTQQHPDPFHASTVQQVNMQHSMLLLLVNRATKIFTKRILVTTHAVNVQQGL